MGLGRYASRGKGRAFGGGRMSNGRLADSEGRERVKSKKAE